MRIRKFVMFLIAVFVLTIDFASGETLQKNQRYKQEDYCVLTLKDVKSYDVFFSQESGTAKDFIVASFSLQNLKTQQFFVKADTAAKIVYDGDFEFEANYLWTNPEGTYYQAENQKWLYVFNMNDKGYISSNYADSNGGFISPSVYVPNEFFSLARGYIDADALYDPQNNIFYFSVVADQFVGPDSKHTFKSIDPSKTVLDPIVERTYHYIFHVPDMVAQDEGNRELIITVGEVDYTIRF